MKNSQYQTDKKSNTTIHDKKPKTGYENKTKSIKKSKANNITNLISTFTAKKTTPRYPQKNQAGINRSLSLMWNQTWLKVTRTDKLHNKQRQNQIKQPIPKQTDKRTNTTIQDTKPKTIYKNKEKSNQKSKTNNINIHISTLTTKKSTVIYIPKKIKLELTDCCR